MPTVEILEVPLKPGSNIGDPNNEAAVVLKEVSDGLHDAPGVQHMHFGMQVEKPEVFQLVVTWDNLDSYKTFVSSEAAQPFLQKFRSVFAGAPTIYLADVEPAGEILKALSAPITEIATFYFGSEAPEGYLAGVQKFRDAADKEPFDAMHASAIGLTHDDIEREGVKGKGAVLLIGWDSVEKHMEFRELEVFKQNAGALRAGVQKAEVHHVQLLKVASKQ